MDPLRAAPAAFARGDIPGVLAALAPDVRWTEAEGFPCGGVYTSPEAVLESVFMKLGTEWEGFSATPEQVVAEGDTVVALGTYEGTYKATGKRISVPFAHVWKIEDTDTALVRDAVS